MVPYLSDPNLTATIFAPTDAAFTAALKAYGLTAAQLLSNKDVLTTVSLVQPTALCANMVTEAL